MAASSTAPEQANRWSPPHGSWPELLGLDDSVAPGYEQIRVKMHVKADCSDEELDDLLAYAQQHSPICNTICRPVPVVVERVMQ